MILTGALLAEHVFVENETLNVRGGVLDWWVLDPGQESITLFAVALLQAAPDDAGTVQKVRLTVYGPSGQHLGEGAVPVDLTVSNPGTNRFTWIQPTFPVSEGPGRYLFHFEIDGQESSLHSLSLDVRSR